MCRNKWMGSPWKIHRFDVDIFGRGGEKIKKP